MLDAQCAQCADTADPEQDFLLEAVLPVAAVEVVGDLAVFLEVGLEIRVEQVEIRAADLAFQTRAESVRPGKAMVTVSQLPASSRTGEIGSL